VTRYVYAKTPATLPALARDIATRMWGVINSATPIACPALNGYALETSTEGHGGIVVLSRKAIPVLEQRPTGIDWPLYPRSWEADAAVVSCLRLPAGMVAYVGEEDCAWGLIVLALPGLAGGLALTWGPDGFGNPRTAERVVAHARETVERWYPERLGEGGALV
jgi:hypothetical protein